MAFSTIVEIQVILNAADTEICSTFY